MRVSSLVDTTTVRDREGSTWGRPGRRGGGWVGPNKGPLRTMPLLGNRLRLCRAPHCLDAWPPAWLPQLLASYGGSDCLKQRRALAAAPPA
jgi:hypothetical protein